MQVSWDHLGLKALKAGGHEKVIPCRLPCRHADVSNWQILSVCKRLQLSILAWSSGHFELRSMRWLPLCGEAINFLASCYCLANILLVRSTPSLGFEVTPRDHDFAELSNIVSEIVPRSFIFLRFFSDLKSGPFLKVSRTPIPFVFAAFLDVFVWGAIHIPVFRELLDLHRWGQVRVLEVPAGPAASHASAQSRLQQLGEGEGGNPLRLVEILQTLGDVFDRCSNVDN